MFSLKKNTVYVKRREKVKLVIFEEPKTCSYNPLMEIPDTSIKEAFKCAKEMAAIVGMKRAVCVGLILYVRFTQNIPEKEKTFDTIKDIIKNMSLYFQNVSDIGCIKNNRQLWYEMNVLIITLLGGGIRR